MTATTRTRPIPTDATVSPATGPATGAAVPPGRLSVLRAAVRARRAQRSELSRRITAYPATRGVGGTVLSSSHHVAGQTNGL